MVEMLMFSLDNKVFLIIELLFEMHLNKVTISVNIQYMKAFFINIYLNKNLNNNKYISITKNICQYISKGI